jgi:Uma2 family endonuclease
MVSTAPPRPASQPEPRILLHNVSWDKLERLDKELEGTGARLTYLDGTLEIMTPLSDDHEDSKSTVSLLIEAYLRSQGIRFYKRGGPTLGKREDGVRREPDESYNIGSRKAHPALILEIVFSSGGINVLDCYARLAIPEVWFWEDSLIAVHCFRGGSYERVLRSELLPNLDLELLAQYSRMADQYDAVQGFSQRIRELL